MKIFFVLLLFCSFHALSHFKCSGEHQECFEKMGVQYKNEIHFVWNKYSKSLTKWKHDHEETFHGFATFIKHNFPKLNDELIGLASGTELGYDNILLLNMQTEIDHCSFSSHPKPIRKADEQCSDVHVNLQNEKLIGHNEDSPEFYGNISFFSELDFGHEKIFAYTYPGTLPGIAFGFNGFGLTFSMNALFPKGETCRIGAPKFIINRYVMGASTFDEAIERTVNFRTRGYGHSINIGSVHDLTRQIVIELSPTVGGVMEVVNGNYSHMNNYRFLNVPFNSDPSSEHRLARMNEMDAPKNKEDILNMLGDTKDSEYPIYRGDFTLCTALYDLKRKEMEIYIGNPKHVQPSEIINLWA